MLMIPTKNQFPRAAGLFGRIAGMRSRIKDRTKTSPDFPTAESYRKSLLRNAVAFTVSKNGKLDRKV